MHKQLGFRQTIPTRRHFRKDPTKPEKLFWEQVARKRFMGLKFIRQHGIGPYIVDFCCRPLNIIVEIDGDSHFTKEGIASDAIRTIYLENLGYKLIRYSNEQVLDNIDGVFEDLKRQIDLLLVSSLKGGETAAVGPK